MSMEFTLVGLIERLQSMPGPGGPRGEEDTREEGDAEGHDEGSGIE